MTDSSPSKGRRILTAVFGVVVATTLVVAVAGILDTGGDAATRGLSRASGIVMLGFAVTGIALFALTRRTAARVVAVLLAGTPILAALALFLASGIAGTAAGFRESALFRFPDPGTRPLADAAQRNDLRKLRGLLAQGVDPNAAGRNGETPLSFALRHENVDAAVILIEAGADPSRRPQGEESPLVTAAGRDAYHLVLAAALARGASPDAESLEGRPLLFEALAFNARANVWLLVEKGARLDLRDADGRSALVRAIFLRMWPAARLMVEKGSPIHDSPGAFNLEKVLSDTRPPDDGTPERGEFRALLEALAERGIGVSQRTGP